MRRMTEWEKGMSLRGSMNMPLDKFARADPGPKIFLPASRSALTGVNTAWVQQVSHKM